MKKSLLLVLSVLWMALQVGVAQTSSDGSYKFQKAAEIIDDKGDVAQARDLLVENIKEYPKHIDSYLLLIGIYRNEEDYGKAMHYVNLALKNNHKGSGISESKILWWRATIYSEMEDYAEAVAVMQQALKKGRKQDPENLSEMLEAMAQFYYENEDYGNSDKIYKEMLKENPLAVLPLVGMARNCNMREQYDQALELLDKCVMLSKDYAEIYRFRMYAYEGKKDYKRMIDNMILLYEKSEDASHLSIAKFLMDKRYASAVLREKIATEKDNLVRKYLLAKFYKRSYQCKKAVQILTELMDEYGYDEDVLEERSMCYKSLGMIDLAIEDIDRAIAIGEESNRPYYYFMRGRLYYSSAQYEKSIEDITAYIDRYPTQAFAYASRALSKEHVEDREGALEDYNEAIALDEEYPYAHLKRGILLWKEGKKEEARQDFERVLALDTAVTMNRGRDYALAYLGRVEEAIKWRNQIIALDEDAPVEWYDKACLLSILDREEEAVEALKVAFEKGYRAFTHIDHDADMDDIREREDFKVLMAQYQQKLAKDRADFERTIKKESEKVVTEVDMVKMYGGTYEVACTVNGLPLKMIFDTGASDVTISSVEANFMLKNGYLSTSDIKGKTNYQVASGEILEGTILRIKEIKLGDAVLKNVDASVVHNQRAPLLLGQSVLERFGTLTIDNVNSKLLIKQ